jgi:hypothetical protein
MYRSTEPLVQFRNPKSPKGADAMRGYTSTPRHLLQRFRMDAQECGGLIAIAQRIKVAEKIRAWREGVLYHWIAIAHLFSPISCNT